MIPVSVKNYCEKHGIHYEMESPTDAFFKAPDGFVFSTESVARVVAIGEFIGGVDKRVMSAKDIKDLLELYPKG